MGTGCPSRILSRACPSKILLGYPVPIAEFNRRQILSSYHGGNPPFISAIHLIETRIAETTRSTVIESPRKRRTHSLRQTGFNRAEQRAAACLFASLGKRIGFLTFGRLAKSTYVVCQEDLEQVSQTIIRYTVISPTVLNSVSPRSNLMIGDHPQVLQIKV